jgi:type II secretory pathway component PulF
MLDSRSTRRQTARYRALADALAAGIPARRAYELVRLEGEPRTTVGASALANGESLTRAIELDDAPPRHHVVALRAAEKAGRLPETLRSLADELDARSSALRTFLQRAAYPLVLMHLVVPAASTSLLIEEPGRFVMRTLVALAVLWGSFLVLFFVLRRLIRDPVQVRRVARWPLIGRILRVSAQLRFLRALAGLYGAGVRIDEALTEASAAVGAAPPTAEYTQAAAIARSGESIDRAMSVLLGLDPLDRMELVTAATAGNLEAALDRVVLRTEMAWEASLHRAARIASTILYVTAFVAVVVAVFSFYAGYFAQLSEPFKHR